MEKQSWYDYMLERLHEPTTYAGIFGMLTALGVAINPDLADAIISCGVGVTGLALIILKEK